MLLTQEIRKKIPKLYAQEHSKDPIVYVKFFTPWTYFTWYATEFDGKDTFFGYVVGHDKEMGYFSLKEMESVRGPFGLKIERDLHFYPTPLSSVKSGKVSNPRRNVPPYVPCRCCGKPVPSWLGSPIHTKCIPKHWGKHVHGKDASLCREFGKRAKHNPASRFGLYGKHPKQRYYRLITVTLDQGVASREGRALQEARAIDMWFTKGFELGQHIPDRYDRVPLGENPSGNPVKPHTAVEVSHIPKCDFCGSPAKYDGRTGFGGWANMCEMHFHEYGVGLGLGKWQRLILKKK